MTPLPQNTIIKSMPELPEVETVRHAMQRHLVGRQIVQVSTSDKRLREPLPHRRFKTLAGDRFTAARRRAKFLLLDLESGYTLLVHLGMSGNLLLRPGGEKHDHVIFTMSEGPPLVFSDPRRFGLVLLLKPTELETCPYLNRLGVEPLDAAFDAAYLQTHCRASKRPIKNLIMDGRIVVGVGNIYASEALFEAGIRPTKPGCRISRTRLSQLVEQIKDTLQSSIRQGGTTISDYRGSGAGGRFQQHLAVYGRADENCLVCEAPIKSVVLAGRSTFYCARCQK